MPSVEQITRVIMEHQRIPTFRRDWENRCSGCDHLLGAPDGANSPRHARHVAEQIAALLEPCGEDMARAWDEGFRARRSHFHDPDGRNPYRVLRPGTEPDAGDGWFLAICQDCEPLLPQPFRVESERDAWADAHAETGHRVLRARGWQQ